MILKLVVDNNAKLTYKNLKNKLSKSLSRIK
jgi:hypothetical protein